jgi:hypothetical protein
MPARHYGTTWLCASPGGTWANAVALATHGIGHFGEARKRVGARVSGVLLVCMSLGH